MGLRKNACNGWSKFATFTRLEVSNFVLEGSLVHNVAALSILSFSVLLMTKIS